jgi:3-oxoacyl-[acyl-carrier protein] reductase
MGKLDGKVAIITGAGRGIGVAVATTFAAEGCKVSLGARTEAELSQTCDLADPTGEQVCMAPCDVADPADVERLFALTLERFGQIDILVNNAGIYPFGEPDVLSLEDFDRCMATNVRGAFICTQLALRHFKPRQTGLIINIASVAGKWAFSHGAAYCTSKFALMGLTEVTVKWGRKHGIRACAICPGGVAVQAGQEEYIASGVSLSPQDVADAALYAAAAADRVIPWEITLMPIGQDVWTA